VIIQDDVSQPFEEQLPYDKFSIRGANTRRLREVMMQAW
jgi:hypothetical protein